MTCSVGLIGILESECFGLFTRLQVFIHSTQFTEMTGEQELDTDSVENKTANELVSSTAT